MVRPLELKADDQIGTNCPLKYYEEDEEKENLFYILDLRCHEVDYVDIKYLEKTLLPYTINLTNITLHVLNSMKLIDLDAK